MRQVLLVAGVDYLWTGVSFRVLADNRRRFLDRRTAATRTDTRYITMDVRLGEVEVREVTFPGGSRTESVTRQRTFDPVGRASYEQADGRVRFKPGQTGVMSVTDVYQRIVDIGAKNPGTLAEVSILSHAWVVGPVLVNSMDDRTTQVLVATPTGPVETTVTLTGTMRDPDDKDGRFHLDFRAPTMDTPTVTLVRAAFAPDGFSWVWGCANDQTAHRTLSAMERARGYSGTSMSDSAVLELTGLTVTDLKLLQGALAPLGGGFPPSEPVLRLTFGQLRFAFCRLSQVCYAAGLAVTTQREVRAAPIGTYADYDRGGDQLMNVHPSYAQHQAFYKNHLGFAPDPEGRRYAIYRPDATCTPPSLLPTDRFTP